MNDDPLKDLLHSPLDDPRPRRRRAGLAVGVVLLAAALAAGGVVLWRILGADESATTSIPAAGPAGPATSAVSDATGAATTAAEAASTTTAATAVTTFGIPDARVYAPLVATDAGVLMMGGLEPVQRLNGLRFEDVWRFDDATGQWWRVWESGGPQYRAGAAAAYDAGSGVVVLFGGAAGSCPYPACPQNLNDTWVYDPAAGTWEERSPAVSPPARHGHTMAYDAQSDRVVLFGGDTGAQWLGDTWAYDSDADAWVEITTAEAPWPVAQQAMAYDPSADRVVLWGGADRQESEVWMFDLETAAWSLLGPGPGPQPAWDSCLVWDEAAGRLVLIGGTGPTVVQISESIVSTEVRARDEVWALDLAAGTWALLGRLPEPVTAHGCARDPGSGAILIWSVDSLLLLDLATGEGLAEP